MAKVHMAAFQSQVLDALVFEISPPRLAPNERKSGAGVVVAHIKPINTEQEREQQRVAGDKVDFANAAHHEVLVSLAVGRKDGRRDVEPRPEERSNGEDINPVGDAYRKLPDVLSPEAGLLGNGAERSIGYGCHQSLLQRTMISASFSPWGPMTCDAQARHGSKEWMVRRISNGRLGSAMGVPRRADS